MNNCGVYAARFTGGWVKVGFSLNIGNRMTQIASRPSRRFVCVLDVLPIPNDGDALRAAEYFILSRLRRYRRGKVGEWHLDVPQMQRAFTLASRTFLREQALA